METLYRRAICNSLNSNRPNLLRRTFEISQCSTIVTTSGPRQIPARKSTKKPLKLQRKDLEYRYSRMHPKPYINTNSKPQTLIHKAPSTPRCQVLPNHHPQPPPLPHHSHCLRQHNPLRSLRLPLLPRHNALAPISHPNPILGRSPTRCLRPLRRYSGVL